MKVEDIDQKGDFNSLQVHVKNWKNNISNCFTWKHLNLLNWDSRNQFYTEFENIRSFCPERQIMLYFDCYFVSHKGLLYMLSRSMFLSLFSNSICRWFVLTHPKFLWKCASKREHSKFFVTTILSLRSFTNFTSPIPGWCLLHSPSSNWSRLESFLGLLKR